VPKQTQKKEIAMSLWYAAHILMYVKRKDGAKGKVTVWENVVLIKADSDDEAFTKADEHSKMAAGDDDGTFRWDGHPAEWIFAGIRKLTLCEDPKKLPGDGNEVSYTEMEVESERAVWNLLQSKPAAVYLHDVPDQPSRPNGKPVLVKRGG
jgi:Domain of unknown function (DUF4288)